MPYNVRMRAADRGRVRQTTKTRDRMASEKTVYVGMVGDMLHVGHINILKTAARLGRVTVGVLTDRAVVGYKRLPLLAFEDRVRVVESIADVAAVVPQKTLSYVENLRALRPDYVVHGDDWRYGDQVSRARAEVIATLGEWGGELVEVAYTKGISSTAIHRSGAADALFSGTRQGRLRRLLAAKPTLRIVEAHSGLSAKIAAEVRGPDGATGFDAVWQSGLTDAIHRGKSDGGAVDRGRRLQAVEEILDAGPLPLIYDGRAAGRPETVFDLTRALDKAGVSALCLGDRSDPDRTGPEMSPAETVAQIEAVRAACPTGAVMAISRIVVAAPGNGGSGALDRALDRALALLEAGSDAVMFDSAADTAEPILDIAARLRRQRRDVPLFAAQSDRWGAPIHRFENAGIDAVVYETHLLRATVAPMRRAATALLAEGTGPAPDLTPLPELRGLFPSPF